MTKLKRAVLVVLDGVGAGANPDAHAYGDDEASSKELGAEHVRSGQPILYTSADSVFHIAAHQDIIPLEELYHICEVARGMLTGDHAVGRVIARPFIGTQGNFTRSKHRRDFSLPRLGTTLLDLLQTHSNDVISVGKIEDLFARRGLTRCNHSETNSDGMAATLRWLEQDFMGLLFVNLVEFDRLWGHRRNSEGYVRALRNVDGWFAQMRRVLRPGVDLGVRSTFADLGQTLAQAFGAGQLEAGTSFAHEIGLS